MVVLVSSKELEEKIVNGLKQDKSYNKRGGRLYAGDGICSRLLAIKATTDTERHNTETELAYQKVGNALESVAVRGMENSGILLGNDLRLPEVEYLNIGGIIDAIALVDGKPHIVEIKTTKDVMVLNPKHYSQAETYSAFLQLPFSVLYIDRKIGTYDRGRLLLTMNTFESEYNEGDAIKRIATLFEARYHIENNSMPDAQLSARLCKTFWCDFYDYCHRNKRIKTNLKKLPRSKSLEYKTELMNFLGKFFSDEEKLSRRINFLDLVKVNKSDGVYQRLKDYLI